MDKDSSQPIRTRHMAKRGTKGDFSSPFFLESDSGERGEHILKMEGF